MQYLVVVEKGEQSYGAYVPDLPGCIAAGDTNEKSSASFEKPLSFILEGLRDSGKTFRLPRRSLR